MELTRFCPFQASHFHPVRAQPFPPVGGKPPVRREPVEPPVLPFLFIVLVTVLSIACAVQPTPIPAPTPPPDPRQILDHAAAQVTSLESLAFDLEHLSGSSLLLPGVEMTRAYGVAGFPDRFRLTVEAQAGGTYLESSVALVGGKSYMTNFLTGRWQEVPPEILPFNFSNLGQDLAGVLQSVQDPTLAGQEPLNGNDTYRIQGTIKSQDLAALVPNATPGYDVGLDLWIDRSQGWLLRAVMDGPVVDTDIPDAARLLTLDAINQPVEIQAPR